MLAYVSAPIVADAIESDVEWSGTHQIVLLNPGTGVRRTVTALNGASVPQWSQNGSDLLYVDNDELWLWPVGQTKPTEVAGPLFPEAEWKTNASSGGQYLSYYNQIPWSAQFSWWSPK